MKVAIVIIVVLLLCCCITALGGFALSGNLALNNSCIWRGPLIDDVNAVTECKKAPVDSSEDINMEDVTPGLLNYTGVYSDEFSFEYDPSINLRDNYSDEILLKLEVENYLGSLDSVNIVRTDYQELDYLGCYEYGETVYGTVTNNTDSNFNYDIKSTWGQNDTCVVYYTFDLEGTEIYQRQAIYQVENNDADYIVTETYVVGSDNISILNDIYNSFEVL